MISYLLAGKKVEKPPNATLLKVFLNSIGKNAFLFTIFTETWSEKIMPTLMFFSTKLTFENLANASFLQYFPQLHLTTISLNRLEIFFCFLNTKGKMRKFPNFSKESRRKIYFYTIKFKFSISFLNLI